MEKTFIAFGAVALITISALGTPTFAQAGTALPPSFQVADGTSARQQLGKVHRPHYRHHYRHNGRHFGGISRAQNAAKKRTDVNNN